MLQQTFLCPAQEFLNNEIRPLFALCFAEPSWEEEEAEGGRYCFNFFLQVQSRSSATRAEGDEGAVAFWDGVVMSRLSSDHAIYLCRNVVELISQVVQ